MEFTEGGDIVTQILHGSTVFLLYIDEDITQDMLNGPFVPRGTLHNINYVNKITFRHLL